GRVNPQTRASSLALSPSDVALISSRIRNARDTLWIRCGARSSCGAPTAVCFPPPGLIVRPDSPTDPVLLHILIRRPRCVPVPAALLLPVKRLSTARTGAPRIGRMRPRITLIVTAAAPVLSCLIPALATPAGADAPGPALHES